ncbi:MFS transporter [Streptomyces sp. S.PB5]|uniref:MFS transporter n=1 Tax=Streptomyces sp. S.PB5 TaxID=3020844 RepID=UPI0025B23E48|nr:MFS transporter [Streptomyces sp. S.PB5]MDN3027936.1 MFS transporter [Streptomyces sp. S.PB5]
MTNVGNVPPTAAAPRGRRAGNRWGCLVVLCVSLLIVTLDNTILNVALPTLVQELDATTTQLQWIVDAYALVFAGLMLVSGSSADRFGRRRVFVAGLTVFGAASAWAAYSGSVDTLIAARAAMGVGAAMMMPATLSIITDVFREPSERRRAIGVWAATSGLGIAIGPVAGGLLLEHFWWGSVFWVNIPVALAGLVGVLLLVPESRNPAALRPDPVGSVLSVAALGLLLWAIIEAPVRGWTSGLVLGAGGVGLAVLVCFVFWERTSTHPMLNLGFFRERRFSVATASVSLAMFGLFGALFVLTQYLQFGLGYTALETGVRILPVAGLLALVAPLSPVLVRWAGTKAVVGTGLVVVAGGLWQLSTAEASSAYGDVLGGMMLLGLGAGLVVPAALDSLMGTLPIGDTGVGSATNGVSVQLGGALGVAVIGSLLTTRYQDRMRPRLAPHRLPQDVSDDVLGSLGGALSLAERVGGTAGRMLAEVARSSFVSGMGLGLVVGSTVAAAGALLAFSALPSRTSRR